MIVINTPQIETEGDFAVISADIEINEVIEKLWYKFPVEFKKFLVTENVDAFLVGILFLGLKSGNDITLKGSVSARLFYTLRHYLIPALTLSNPEFYKIKIFARQLNHEDLNRGEIAGTGMSCGIDSFATYFDHLKEVGPYKINYFTFFNVGSHLDFGGEKARKIYQNRLKSVNEFAQNEDKEVISVDSNLSEILKMNFQQTHSLRSISCVLHLQKLFKSYYYASAYRFDHFKLNPKDTSDFDLFNVQMLSTESTNFFASAAQYSRVERTIMVAEHPETYQKLNVCTNPSLQSDFINCSSCYKCLRTQLTLDIANKLDLYKDVFDIRRYYKIKDQYIGQLLTKNKKSPLDIEVIEFLKLHKYKPSVNIYYYGVTSWLNFHRTKFKKLIKDSVKKISK